MTADTLTQRIWLHLLAQGGHWTATELAAVFGKTYAQADTLLWGMARRGYVAAARIEGRKNGRGYGVVRASRIPAGIPLADVLKATLDNPQPEEAAA